MNPKDFRGPRAGKVIQTPKGYSAFIPAKLPPTLVAGKRSTDIAVLLPCRQLSDNESDFCHYRKKQSTFSSAGGNGGKPTHGMSLSPS
jgi:hypothetical protein